MRKSNLSKTSFLLFCGLGSLSAFHTINNSAIGIQRRVKTGAFASPYSDKAVGLDTFLLFSKTEKSSTGEKTTISHGGSCVSNLIAKIPDPEASDCTAAFVSAGHCATDSQGDKPKTWEIEFAGKRLPLKMAVFGPNLVRDYVTNHRVVEVQKSDADGDRVKKTTILEEAITDLVVFRTQLPCKSLEGIKPARLAACEKNGDEEVVSLKKGDIIFRQKRTQALPGSNSGGGRNIAMRLTELGDKPGAGKLYEAIDVMNGAPPVEGGDSGSPLRNEKGDLVSVMGRTATGREAYFDPTAVCKARAQLKKWDMWPPVREYTEQHQEQEDGPANHGTKENQSDRETITTIKVPFHRELPPELPSDPDKENKVETRTRSRTKDAY